jgi:hypothetical protein
MPVEIDLDLVRRERQRGVRGLGQTLKSFRDRVVDFPVYARSASTEAYLASLGPVLKQIRPAATAAPPPLAPAASPVAPALDTAAPPPVAPQT